MASPARTDQPAQGSSRWQRSAQVAHALPETFLVVTAVAAAVGVAAAASGQRPLASRGASLAVVLVLVVLALGVVVSRGRQPTSASDPGLLPAVPALVLAGYAAGARLLSPGDRAEWFLGGDHVRHLLFVAEIRESGSLDYAAQPYPRAWHTLVATAWSASGGEIDGPGLRSLIDVLSTATWFLPALLSLATGSLTVALAARCGADVQRARRAGLGAAAAILLPPFLGTYQMLGFENSYVGAIVLAVVAREVLVHSGGPRVRGSLVAVVGLVVCAHSWQLLVAGVGVAYLWLVWGVVASGSARDRVVLVAASAGGAVACLPALLAVFTVIGVQHATDSQIVAPMPLELLLAGLAAAAVVAARARARHDRAPLAFLLIVLSPLATTAYLVVRVGVSATDYYPSKLLWHSAVLGLSPLAVLLVQSWSAAANRDEAAIRGIRRFTAVAAALGLVMAFVSPMAAFVGAWSSTRGPLVVDAITSPGAGGAQVVWLGTDGDDTYGRILLDFYRVPDPRRTPQAPLDVSEECALLLAAERPAVLTNRTAQEVRSRYACVPTVERVAGTAERDERG